MAHGGDGSGDLARKEGKDVAVASIYIGGMRAMMFFSIIMHRHLTNNNKIVYALSPLAPNDIA